MPPQPPSPRLKIERAKEHIGNLEPQIVGFRQRRPYRAIFKKKVDNGLADFVVQVEEDIPLGWSVLVGEVVYNARTSLENAWFDISGRPDHRKARFPLRGNAAAALEAGLHREKHGRMQAAMQTFLQIKNGATGDPFGMLVELDESNKHRLPLLCASRLTQGVSLANQTAFLTPLEEGAVLTCLLRPGDQVNMENELPFEVTFAETEITKGDAVIPSLRISFAWWIASSRRSRLPVDAARAAHLQ